MSEGRAAATVLVVEDNPGDARLVRALLSEVPGQNWRLEHVERLETALARLDHGGIDVVLLDLSLPDSYGVSTVDAVCARAKTPVVVHTGFGDEAKGAEAVRRGAENYVVKGRPGAGPLLSEILAHAVERHRRRELAGQASDSLGTAMRELQTLQAAAASGEVGGERLAAALAACQRSAELLRLLSS
jgi:DNA-binding NtrC family response regulator